MEKINYSYDEFTSDINELVNRIQSEGKEYDAIIAIARGGITISHFLSVSLNIKNVFNITASSYDNDVKVSDVKLTNVPNISKLQRLGEVRLLIVDDISDTGETFREVSKYFSELTGVIVDTLSLHINDTTSFVPTYFKNSVSDKWIMYPWDTFNE